MNELIENLSRRIPIYTWIFLDYVYRHNMWRKRTVGVISDPLSNVKCRQIMEKGSSEPWRDVLFQATGESRLSGAALREYFRPLEEWLRNENLRTGEFVGWLYDGDYCKQSIQTAGLQVYGGFYNNARKIVPSYIISLIGTILTLYRIGKY